MYAICGMNSIYLSYWLTRICLVYAKSLLVWKRSRVAMFLRICLELKPSSVVITCYQPWNIKLCFLYQIYLTMKNVELNQYKIIRIYFVKGGRRLTCIPLTTYTSWKELFSKCCASFPSLISLIYGGLHLHFLKSHLKI